MTVKAHYIDEVTGGAHALDAPIWRSPEGNTLAVSDLPGISQDDIDISDNSLWRYQAALPVAIERPVTLGEGRTPLIPHPDAAFGARLKLEWFAPTGSFKDRGAAVMVSYLRQLGIERILEDSSGNGGAAIAAYAAAAGLGAKILAPAHAQPSKIAQISAYGAEVQLVPGPRENTEHEALRQADEIFYASHNWHPFFLQGTKTIGYELWEDLGFKAPDNIIIPSGAGSNIMGCDLAFTELLRAGQIDRLPRLFAAQPANCAPIDASFRAGSDELVPCEILPTVAEGTAIKSPARLKTVLAALRRCNGGTAAVSEEDIIATVRRLAGWGLFAEPTSASALAAYDQLVARGEISASETTIIVLTGSGLKAASFMTELFNPQEAP